MRFEQISDVLEHVHDFHARAAARFQELASHTDRQREKMLLDYMAERETALAGAVEAFMDESGPGLMKGWAQPGEGEHALAELLKTPIPDDLDLDGLLDHGMQISGQFESVFEHAATRAKEPDVAAIFNSLLATTRKEREKLARNANMLMDF